MAKLLQLNTGGLQNSQLTVLRRVDPTIAEILTSSSCVAIYIYKQDENKWERKNIEGPFYLVRRSTSPQFSFVILNRKGNQYMVELIDNNFEFNYQEPPNTSIIFRNTKAQEPLPHSIWFKSAIDRDKVWPQIQQIMNTLKRSGQATGNTGNTGNTGVVLTSPRLEEKAESALMAARRLAAAATQAAQTMQGTSHCTSLHLTACR